MTPAPAPELSTSRLLLRRWRDGDLEPWAAMNADPEVMEHFPSTLTREKADALAELLAGRLTDNGYGLWAVEVVATGEFIGFTGLNDVTFDAPFTPAIEVGWRLARSAWGHGYATEAARAALEFAFTTLGRQEVVSFTATSNLRSMAVMERLGMVRDPDGDFHHPAIGPATHPLSLHVLYRLRAEDWRG